MKTLTAELSAQVVQGMDQNDLQPNRLLRAQSSVSSAYLRGSSGVSSSAQTLFGNLQDYVPPISISIGSSISYASEQERMQIKVEEILRSINEAIRIPLSTMLADEDEFATSFGSTIVHAQRARIGSIWTQMHYSGLYLKVPNNVLSHTNYNREEVLQIIKVNTENPLGFNQVSNAPVNTYVAEALFMDTDTGSEISVSSLQDDELVEMYIFNTNALVYDINSSLVNSLSYDPFSNTDGTTLYLEAGRVVEATISRVYQDAAAIHIQIQVDFFGGDGKLDAKLFKDDVALTEDDGDGVQPRTITPAMMSGPVDHREFTFFDTSG